jgi:hypothetical protein
MEDNYLWDRSGEPDPAIQELEAILGTLRYQPRPLEIPHHIQMGRRRSFVPAMAIAAAIALFAVLLGVWFGFSRRQAPGLEAKHDKQIDQKATTPQLQDKSNNAASQALVQSSKPRAIQRHSEAPRNLPAVYRNSPSRAVIRPTRLTPEELAEKEQVLVALRLVSAKLNLAQRKAQGLPQLNTIRNQHKIG